MKATQLIANEVSKVLSENDLYQSYHVRWRYLLESYLGGDEYRENAHLIRYANETDGEYNARLSATPLDNHCQSVVSIYSSFLFREPPYRELGSIANSPVIDDFLKDCDHEGRTINHFMKDLSIWVSVFGHAWMMITKPNTGAITQADEIAQGARPYLSMMTPLVVIDWEWERKPSGKYELSYFKYIEDINGDVYTVKEWTQDLVKTTVVDSVKKTFVGDALVETNGLGTIPAIICYNKRSSVRGIGISDIKDIADQQRFIYNAKSEAQQSIMLNTHPSLVKTPNTVAGIGAGSIIHMDESMDPALKPYLLEFNGASIASIYQSIDQAESMIDKLANTGAIRATESRTMSGVAMETEFQMLNARLSDKANSIELAEETMWQLWAKYMNLTWDGVVNYPDSFNIRDGQTDLEFYLTTMTANVPSETFKKEIYRYIADLAVDDSETLTIINEEIQNSSMGMITVPEMPEEEMPEMEEEDEEMEDEEEGFEVHIMMDPTSSEMVIAKTPAEHEELAAQGWVHI